MVVLTGAGMSAESGIKTFRDANGLWEGHDVMDVATLEAFEEESSTCLRVLQSTKKTIVTGCSQ